MIGAAIGPYVIERELGRGGMGVVYAARHGGLKQRVAVKVLLPELSGDPGLLERFFAEAQAAAASRHPGIIQILHVDRLGGAAYIVMEYLEGESLSARLARCGPLPVPEALAILRQLASALSAAHSAGVIHRDLKPDNIHIVPDPDMPLGERTKILDFGIAKIATLVAGHGALTRTGTVMGTPQYMSPEQCRGRGGVDHRSDLYALGCIAFELLTGQVPFPGEVGEVIGAHQYRTAPDLRTLRPEVPRPVERLVAVLLAKSPQDRPTSAAAVVATLDDLAPRTKTGPRRATEARPATQERPRPHTTTMGAAAGEAAAAAPRRRWPVIVGAAVLGALATTVALVLITRSPHDDHSADSSDAARRAVDAAAPFVEPAITLPATPPSDATATPPPTDPTDPTADAARTHAFDAAPSPPIDRRESPPPAPDAREHRPPRPPTQPAPPTATIDLADTLDRAEQAARRGEWSVALTHTYAVLDADPHNARALIVAALAACSQRMPANAALYVARLPATTAAQVRKACAAKGVPLAATDDATAPK